VSRILSLAALSVLELSPPEMVSCAAAAGYKHVGLRLLPATMQEVAWPMVGETSLVREVRTRLSDTGIGVLDVEILRLKPDTRVEDYQAALETGARLGARNVLVAGNDPDEGRLTARFAALCDLAAPLDLCPGLEPMPWTDVRDFAQARRIVTAAGRSNAGIIVDPIHFDRGGSVPSEIAQTPSAWLRYAQLCDAPRERPADTEGLLLQARAERLLPGDGGLDLAGILMALPPDIPLSLEIPMVGLAKTVGAVERARRMRAATLALLSRLPPRAPAY
jgi:sugar phosphate isomerase/epimerase